MSTKASRALEHRRAQPKSELGAHHKPLHFGRNADGNMATERLLKSTLTLYHDNGHAPTAAAAAAAPPEVADRIFGSTTTLLTTLTNPRNITLLTSHFLTAPAIWAPLIVHPPSRHHQAPQSPEQAARVCFRVISVFNTAAIHVRRHELEEAAAARHGLAGWAAYRQGIKEDRRPGAEAWARAVAEGADGKSPRWRHLLVLVGVLLGLESGGRQALSGSRRAALEQGVVAAANLALAESTPDAPALSRYAVVMGLNYVFPMLSEHVRAGLNGDALLPAIVDVLAGPFGFDGGRILDVIAGDPLVTTNAHGQLQWPESSASFQQLHTRETQQAVSIVASAGPLAAMAAFAVEQGATTSPEAVLRALDGLLLGLAEALAARWATCGALSRLDLSLPETALLGSAATAQTTWPLLWQHLKKILYAVAVVLQAMVGRSLLDRVLASDAVAPQMAIKVLRVLRGLDFVASRDSAGHFQAFRFVYLASIDILSRYPDASAGFLSQLVPLAVSSTMAPSTAIEPLRLTSDLFYLNLAEHFAAVLPSAACDQLLVQPAVPYLMPVTGPAPLFGAHQHLSPRMVEVFEAAHSATLSVLSRPHNAAIAAALAPFYADALFASFPARISVRQFRLAFKTLIQILSPPFPVYATHPDLAETLLEIVRFRAATTAGTAPLPPSPTDAEGHHGSGSGGTAQEPVSEQSTLVLTLIDALPFLALPVLEEWMTTAAEAVWTIRDGANGANGASTTALRQTAQRRFWEVLGSGEMDVERAAVGVAWWGNGGGGELVMTGRRQHPAGALPRRPAPRPPPGPDPVVMSGALGGPATSTKL